jgi:hypothetical protein
LLIVTLHEGERISASWRADLPFASFASNTNWTVSASAASASNFPSEGIEQFKQFTELIERAKAAKEAGDQSNALSLIDEAVNRAKQLGVPDYILQRMHDSYL